MATKKKTAVATTSTAGALAAMDFGDHSGVGTQNMTSADQAIPFLSCLQALSKVIADPTQKVKGAEAGMIMDSVSKELYSGDKGVAFLPCNTKRVFVEWQGEPGSGTVVGRYAPNDPVVKEANAKFSFNELQSPKGNRLVETFYLIGMILDDDMVATSFAIMSFTSTKIKSYKASIGVIRTIAGNAPLYAFPLRITTKAETRTKGTSYNFVVSPLGHEDKVFKVGALASVITPDSPYAADLFAAGKILAADFDADAANVAYDTEGSHGGDKGGGSEDEPY